MIDYIFRHDPAKDVTNFRPATAAAARQALIRGNRRFSEWMAKCRSEDAQAHDYQYIVPCGSLTTVPRKVTEMPLQQPFAVVLGCSDARVPTEMLFGQGFNDLFVVRVAGNVLGDVVMGSTDFSIRALAESVRVMVVLGHVSCGAVKGAVQAYLEPEKFWAKSNSTFLQLIFRRIFTAVRESDNALRAVWGADASTQPGYHEALLNMAVCLNAAHAAYVLRQQVETDHAEGVEVVYGIFDIRTHQVCMPVLPDAPINPDLVNLAPAPSDPHEFTELAHELASLYRDAGAA